MKAGLIGAIKNVPIPEEYIPVAVAEDGSFTFNVDTSVLGAGMFVVEVVAKSAGGNEVSKGVAVSTIPYLTYLRCKRQYSEFIFEQIQTYCTNVIMEFNTTQSFVKSFNITFEYVEALMPPPYVGE